MGTQYISYGVFLFGYFLLIFFGELILSVLKSNVDLGSSSLIMLFSFSTFFSRWGGMTLVVSNQSNHVVEHINALIVSIVFFATIFLLYKQLHINVFPFAQIVAMLSVMPVIASQVYGTLNTNFIKYEKKVMIPMLGILIFINLLCY